MSKSTSTITKYRIGVITASPAFAGAEPAIEPQLKLIYILEPLSKEVIWVATNCRNIEQRLIPKAAILGIDFPYYLCQRNEEAPFLRRVLFFLLHQMKIVFALFKLRQVDIFVFACGADLYVLPMLFGKLLRKTIILRSDGRPSGVLEKYHKKAAKFEIGLLKMVERVSYLLADKLLPDSEGMVNLYNLDRYQKKIGNGSLYVDAPFLKTSKKLADRVYRIGYVGRFSREKGVLEFAHSLSFLLQGEHVRAIMIGDGDLKDDIEQILVRGKIQDKVKLTGWVPNKELSSYLGDIEIVIVPSYVEGLPNLVLEAMGCSCIVVGTRVGGIPDVIKDGETGFIMKNNSPKSIAKNVIRAFNHPDLEEIAQNAHILVEREYTYETAVERYRSILTSLEHSSKRGR